MIQMIIIYGQSIESYSEMFSAILTCSMWRLDKEAMIAYKNIYHSVNHRYPMSPRMSANRKFNSKFRSQEDLMTRSTGFDLPY